MWVYLYDNRDPELYLDYESEDGDSTINNDSP